MKNDVVKLVIFQLGMDLFATEVYSAERVLRYTPPNSVPDLPEWIEGVLSYREKVIPVVDMRRRIELAETSVTPDTRILVLVTKDGWVGAVVDTVHEVAVVPKDAITPPPALFRGLSAEFVRGIAKVNEQLVIVLDVERVLTSGDRIAFEEAVDKSAKKKGKTARV
jgi:purine-binding chemotaxis protein CheW